MPQTTRTPTLMGQAVTCALMLMLACAITAAFHPRPLFASWVSDASWTLQASVSLAFVVAAIVACVLVLAVPSLRLRMPVPNVVRSIDLRGGRPFAIGAFAGLGEEALFRAALQPLLGLWFGAAMFAVAHARTAMFGTSVRWKQFAYVGNVFAAGVALGLVYEHFGLLCVIVIHATIDIAALTVARELTTSASRRSSA